MKTEEYIRWRLELRKKWVNKDEKLEGKPIVTADKNFQEGWIAALEWVLRDE